MQLGGYDSYVTNQEKFSRQLLRDMRALEVMLGSGMIESGVKRIGAEQELYIVDGSWHPVPAVHKVLARLDDNHFSVEIAKFNIELNLDPVLFGYSCLSALEEHLNNLLSRLIGVTGEMGLKVIMAGILPTIRRSDLSSDNLTEDRRYESLTSILNEERGDAYEFRIRGIDELIARHNTPMFESCNTSFQVHLQVSPEDAVNLYNVSQAAAGPLLASATNSPLLLGKRLWSETRIALFQQAVDSRAGAKYGREKSARVSFGRSWLRESILEFFQDNIARYRVLLSPETGEDSLTVLGEGRVPELEALQIYNGTVWRWNRVCYGITRGIPHLRIENRVLPSGPTVRDEVSNAAFWLGMMGGIHRLYPDITRVMEFDSAKGNFINAARTGLDVRMKWAGGGEYPARELVLDELLPLSREGLGNAGIVSDEISLYLDVIEERVRSGKTGSRWILDSLGELRLQAQPEEAVSTVTASMYKKQLQGDPVHMWKNAELKEGGKWAERCRYVEQVMSIDLFVVRETDLIDLAVCLMDWKHVRHVPVEDEKGHFTGLLTSGIILNYYASSPEIGSRPVKVADIMIRNPVTVSPDTETIEAVRIMHDNKIGCLPVVKEGALLGIITEHDFMSLSANLLSELLEANETAKK